MCSISIKEPKHLYIILSNQDWQESQMKTTVVITTHEDVFIHLATEGQLDRIIEKYWSSVPQHVVLKLDTARLEGKLVYEVNPGGSTKYYHLYNGAIPLNSVIEFRTINH